jgi:hypothetical protein
MAPVGWKPGGRVRRAGERELACLRYCPGARLAASLKGRRVPYGSGKQAVKAASVALQSRHRAPRRLKMLKPTLSPVLNRRSLALQCRNAW